jgi:hypothetical protein
LTYVDLSFVVPGGARAEVSKRKMVSIRNQWPVGVFVKCGSNERLSLRGASTNEHFFEMPMKSHQRTSA